MKNNSKQSIKVVNVVNVNLVDNLRNQRNRKYFSFIKITTIKKNKTYLSKLYEKMFFINARFLIEKLFTDTKKKRADGYVTVVSGKLRRKKFNKRIVISYNYQLNKKK